MHRRFPACRLSILILLLTGALLGSQPATARQDRPEQRASELAQRLSEHYDGIASMRLRFVQTATSTFMDTDERYAGDLVFTDTSYRIETSNQTIVSDGITTWVYNRGQDQVIINDFVEDEGAFSLTTFLRSFSEEYTPHGRERRPSMGSVTTVFAFCLKTVLPPSGRWTCGYGNPTPWSRA